MSSQAQNTVEQGLNQHVADDLIFGDDQIINTCRIKQLLCYAAHFVRQAFGEIQIV